MSRSGRVNTFEPILTLGLSDEHVGLAITEQIRTELYYHKQKYLWQAARIANMAIMLAAYNDLTNTTYM